MYSIRGARAPREGIEMRVVIRGSMVAPQEFDPMERSACIDVAQGVVRVAYGGNNDAHVYADEVILTDADGNRVRDGMAIVIPAGRTATIGVGSDVLEVAVLTA